MSTTNDSPPVIVTGEQHTHPAVRLLARACIALAELELADEQTQVAQAEQPEVGHD